VSHPLPADSALALEAHLLDARRAAWRAVGEFVPVGPACPEALCGVGLGELPEGMVVFGDPAAYARDQRDLDLLRLQAELADVDLAEHCLTHGPVETTYAHFDADSFGNLIITRHDSRRMWSEPSCN
jgi:hypothetical protein